MVTRSVRSLLVAALCASVVSCQSLDSIEQSRRGGLEIATLPSRDAIPSEYGRILGVTSRSDAPDVAQLWFEKPDGTIILVSVHTRHGRLSEKALVIPRK